MHVGKDALLIMENSINRTVEAILQKAHQY